MKKDKAGESQPRKRQRTKKVDRTMSNYFAKACSYCGREDATLKKCRGSCGGDAVYCGKSCQRADWSMHKKICPTEGKSVAQRLTFEVSHPPGHPFAQLPAAPLKAIRRMDGIGGSGMTLLFSDHLGIEPLLPYAEMMMGSCESEEENMKQARALADNGDCPYELHVTTPVEPTLMKLKPEEACFNIAKFPDAIKALLSNGIITDTGKRVKIGYYSEDFPVCRINAPQTDNVEDIMRLQKMQEEMLNRLTINRP